MSKRLARLALIVTLGAAIGLLVACGGGAQGPSVTVSDAWARSSPTADGNSAIYMTIKNAGSEADALVKAATSVSNVTEIHEMIMENQVMKMRPVAGQRLDIPAGGNVELKPGGVHLMLIGLKQQLKPGDKVDVTLTFEKSGDKTVQAEVRALEGMEGMQH